MRRLMTAVLLLTGVTVIAAAPAAGKPKKEEFNFLRPVVTAPVDVPWDKYRMTFDSQPLPDVDVLAQWFPGGFDDDLYDTPPAEDNSYWEAVKGLPHSVDQNGRMWMCRIPACPLGGLTALEVWVAHRPSPMTHEATVTWAVEQGWRPATHREAVEFGRRFPDAVTHEILAIADSTFESYSYRGYPGGRELRPMTGGYTLLYPWKGSVVLSYGNGLEHCTDCRVLLVRPLP